ncbi:MAG TPA: ABC transporter permease [Acidimicrobiia bacterium]|jgi:putative ABC transport system permease protein|nr:ABC transporter permease [Acidimicrobiia bacterium]
MSLDSLRVALRALRANRMRSALTMLGILMGTAAVIMLVAVGVGISNQVQGQISKLGTNAVFVLNEKNAGGQDRGGTNARQIRLTRADVKALSDHNRTPDVARVSPVMGTPGTVTWSGATYSLSNFSGVQPAWGEIRSVHVQRGRWLTDADNASHAKVAVIGTTVVDHLFPKDVDPVGQTISFNNVFFEIVGLQEHRGASGTLDQDDVIYAPISTVIENVVGEGTDSYTVIGVQALSRDAITSAVAEVSAVLRQTHATKPGERPDFRIFNAADLVAAGKATARSFRILLAIVAAISLVIGGIGVMNIMLVTVTERTREIGIRKALGAETSDILTQFLSEAVLLSGIGGLIGTVVGVAVGHFRIAAVQPVVSPGSVALSFGVSVLIGIFFGGYPATRAAGLTPIVALRYE